MVLERYKGNPILKPLKKHYWEKGTVYNAGAIYLNGKVHLVYRAQPKIGGVSSLGYAVSDDGFRVVERLEKPIFTKRANHPEECYGLEDPRLVVIGGKIYMVYSVFGIVPKLVRKWLCVQNGLTTISVEDFLSRRWWRWGERIYPMPRVDNKDGMLFPEKINNKWVLIHRISPYIWIAYSDDLVNWDGFKIIMKPQERWEYLKIGGSCPPIKTDAGWLFIYHGVDNKLWYRLGVALIDLNNPEKVIKRSRKPILVPEEKFERIGPVPNVVFSCGAVVIEDTIFVYYGACDHVLCVATCKIKKLLDFLYKNS